jgi:cytochrome c biogenesis protein
MSPVIRKVLQALASPLLTLACIVGAALLAVAGGDEGWPIGTTISFPFGLMFVNLLAALVTNPKLQRQAGLLGFHVALAALALIVAVDRLTTLSGHVEITEGAAFDPRLVESKSGPLHDWRLDDVRFLQGTFEIAYAPGMKRRETESRVQLLDAGARWRSVEVGDDHPLVIGGYRFYTTFNKGFAPVVSFIDAQGRSHRGAIHLPSYPLNYYRQGNSWAPPGSADSVKVWLRIPEPVYRESAQWTFQKPENERLVVTDKDKRWELARGETAVLANGQLRYEELRTWMGYKISYSPFGPWLAAAAALGILSLGYHVLRRRLSTPWHIADNETGGRHVR